MTTIIGLSGKAGSGKDSFVAGMPSYVIPMAFADPLKQGCEAIFGLKYDQLYGRRKDEKDEFWGVTPKRLMQQLGTEAVRNVMGEDVWVRALERRITDPERVPADSIVVITDVRFLNEVSMIKRLGGKVFRVKRPGLVSREPEHVSETALDGYTAWDGVLVNDGPLALWRRKGLELLATVVCT